MKKEFVKIVSERNIINDERLDSYKVDGKKPKLVVFPENIEQISEIIKLAYEKNLKIIPRGGGTKINIGDIPSEVDVVLSLSTL